MPPEVEAEAITLAVQLAQQAVNLLTGTKSVGQVTAEVHQTLAQNNDWLVEHGFPPVPTSGA